MTAEGRGPGRAMRGTQPAKRRHGGQARSAAEVAGSRTGRERPAPQAGSRAARAAEASWSLERDRPGIVPFVLESLRELYGAPAWSSPRPATDELVLTILSQHTSDLNAERAYQALVSRLPSWDLVAHAPTEQVAAAISGGGLAQQKAPRIQAALRAVHDARGDYALDFLAGMEPRAARDWLTALPGIGPKTASVVLLFCFGLPLMPIDTHVHRVTLRIGLFPAGTPADRAHDMALRIFPLDRMYEAHLNLITHGRRTCHARRPACERCTVSPRCRYVNPDAP